VIRVGVIGACGRMGQLVARAVIDDPGLSLVAAVDRSHPGRAIGPMVGRPEVDVPISDELGRLLEADVEVAVEFTHPDVVMENLEFCITHAIDTVVGTSGFDDARLARLGARLEEEGGESNVLVAPNFALGAVLMQRFAAEAARHLADVEIVELHHDGKADAPSGTAIATAGRIAEARGARPASARPGDTAPARGQDVDGVRIHAIRLPGLVAHQEVIFGGPGETLTIRQDTTDRSAFVPGILLAIRKVTTTPGLTVGLEALLAD
jgi:4-hydroxy-tetrahydrodipicolinate reductase